MGEGYSGTHPVERSTPVISPPLGWIWLQRLKPFCPEAQRPYCRLLRGF
jgi:hypothetical protein